MLHFYGIFTPVQLYIDLCLIIWINSPVLWLVTSWIQWNLQTTFESENSRLTQPAANLAATKTEALYAFMLNEAQCRHGHVILHRGEFRCRGRWRPDIVVMYCCSSERQNIEISWLPVFACLASNRDYFTATVHRRAKTLTKSSFWSSVWLINSFSVYGIKIDFVHSTSLQFKIQNTFIGIATWMNTVHMLQWFLSLHKGHI